MFYTGSGAVLQFGKETTFGTAVTPTGLFNLTSESIKASVEKTDEGSLIAGKTALARDLMAVNVDGSISAVLRPEMAGLLFHAALGGADTVTNGTTSGTYKHTMHLCGSGDGLPSLTFVMDRHAAVKKYAGCTISTLSLECAASDYIKPTVEITGVKEEEGTLASGLSMTAPAYKCVGASFTVGGNTFDITTATWKLDNSLQDGDRTYASGLYKGQPQHGQREVSISFEMPYNGTVETFKDTYLLTEATASIVLKFKASDEYQVTITMPHVAITDVTANVSGTDKINASAEGIALTVGTDEPVTVEILDKTSTAYSA